MLFLPNQIGAHRTRKMPRSFCARKPGILKSSQTFSEKPDGNYPLLRLTASLPRQDPGLSMLRTAINTRAFIRTLLALPSAPMIIAMILTPMRMLFPASEFWIWMMERRRCFGVAAFACAVFHTVPYLVDIGSLRAVPGDALALGNRTGWVAVFVFVPLAVTTNDWSVRRRTLPPDHRRCPINRAAGRMLLQAHDQVH